MKKTIKISIALIMLFVFSLEVQRSWSGYPKVVLYVPASQVAEFNSLDVEHYFGNFSQFVYFTTLSNLIMLIVVLVTWVFMYNLSTNIKAYSLTYMIVTTIIFWTSIAPYFLWSNNLYFSSVMVYEHTFPTIVGIYLVWRSKQDCTFKKGILHMSLFPILYTLFVIIFYISINGNISIYPFFNFKNIFFWNLNIYLSIFLSIIFIIGTTFAFIGIYWVIYKCTLFKNVLAYK